jgi:hypothetical protein
MSTLLQAFGFIYNLLLKTKAWPFLKNEADVQEPKKHVPGVYVWKRVK